MRPVQGDGKFIPCECDVSKHENLKDVFHWIKNNVGVIQIMVNNAGLFVPGTIIGIYLNLHIFSINPALYMLSR